MKGIEGTAGLVTGAGSGIGRATAKRFAAEGAQVVVADIDEDGGHETVEQIDDDGGDATFVETDVTDESDVEQMVEETVDTYGQLDFAHNNAGIGAEMVPLTEQTEDTWDSLYEINLKGVWRCLKEEIPVMLEHGGGAIVNTSSVSGLGGDWNMTPYNSTKHGVVGLTRSAALEFGGEGIRINAVCPGVIETPMVNELLETAPEDVEQMIIGRPMDRFGQPDEVASATVWLCSDDASFITGHPLAIDGGVTALH
ncbi:SDR family oxidoreductase [Natrialba sp. INN-245]|uniref:SDR family oxidoreductase n=1 Tax=Natrialba sp. INN-245 TaxID=2690967 RepID=UPI00130FAE0B|nr:SDR family oxidoreductase [Natrialba sp. INN-245]MWV41926.1 SDR family oxidoreductase [Natrialba sp. INN-245]